MDKKDNFELSTNSINSSNKLDKFFNDRKKNQQNNLNSLIIKDENANSKEYKKKLNYFLDTFYFKGKEFEYHIQILLIQILKFFEREENSFKFLHNINFKLGKIYKDINKMEFDFVINNLDYELFHRIINYLKKIFSFSNLKEKHMKLKKQIV